MAGGIQKANGLSWSSPTRIAFLIADAPCHGLEFHDFDDTYPHGTLGIDIKKELAMLLSNCKTTGEGTMSVYFGKITTGADRMIRRFD